MTDEQRIKLELMRERHGNALVKMLVAARREMEQTPALQGAPIGEVVDYAYAKSEGR